MMTIHEKLKNLYAQKLKIEQEIKLLENQLEQNPNIQNKNFTKDQKINIFKSLFISRYDIYAKFWQNQDKTKQNYYPVTKTFKGEDYIPLKDDQIELHLRGKIDIATYMIVYKTKIKYSIFVSNKIDTIKLIDQLNRMNISFCCEYYSNDLYRIWIFYDNFIDAKIAKVYTQKILQEANCEAKILPKESFVNQNSLGTYVDLPLQLNKRDKGYTVFVDPIELKVIDDPWLMLNSIKRLSLSDIEKLINIEDLNSSNMVVLEDDIEFPYELELSLYDYIYIPLQNLSKDLISSLKLFATFPNPQIKILQNLRKPLYNTPRVLKGYDIDEYFLKMPRGLFLDIKNYLEKNSVKLKIKDRRLDIQEIFPNTVFQPRKEQKKAIDDILKYDCSICVAPPGFGKTFIASSVIVKRSVNSLILVHKNMLLDQWIQRFVQYFNISKKEIGFLGKGKNKLNGKLDIATMQSLKNKPELIENYSFVIVDECHHLPAVTFEQIIKQFHGKYILGLSATPNRKDDLQPILFQQIGPIAYEHKKKRTSDNIAYLIKSDFQTKSDTFAQILNELINDEKRNQIILDSIIKYQNRKVLVLSDRIEHINNLEILCDAKDIKYVSVHGSLNKKEQQQNMKEVENSNLVFASTSFFGEGIDFAHLDTIIFATPISYYGRLIQYLGRVGRDGSNCIAVDILDDKNIMLNSMFRKRKSGYAQMHYKIVFE
jgi:superfamily II DNA or RNA helicase